MNKGLLYDKPLPKKAKPKLPPRCPINIIRMKTLALIDENPAR